MSIKGNWRRHGSEVVIRWYQRFFSRRFATRNRGFAAQFCRPQREKNLWHQGNPSIASTVNARFHMTSNVCASEFSHPSESKICAKFAKIPSLAY